MTPVVVLMGYNQQRWWVMDPALGHRGIHIPPSSECGMRTGPGATLPTYRAGARGGWMASPACHRQVEPIRLVQWRRALREYGFTDRRLDHDEPMFGQTAEYRLMDLRPQRLLQLGNEGVDATVQRVGILAG